MDQLDAQRLRRRILRNRLCSAVFKSGKEVFLVGGYLRDLIIRGTHSKDIDFAVRGNVRSLVREVASALGGRVVELRKERMLRVALHGGRFLDFSKMTGDIEVDLGGRDFTINALAWSPETSLIDPCGGLQDIRRGVVRAIDVKNLNEDPLRLLRAYRFSAELNMPVTMSTRRMIRPLVRNIRSSARERITLEFFKLLNSKNPIKPLEMAINDGLLLQIIPLNNKEFLVNLKLMSSLMSHPKKRHERLLFKEFSQGLSRLGLLRLELLMRGAQLNDSLLSVSCDIRKRLDLTSMMYEMFKYPPKSRSSELFELFWAAGDAAEDLLLICDREELMAELRRFRRIKAKGLIGSEEVMDASGIRGGPRLGGIIREMKRLQFTGGLRDRETAMRWILGN
jgi:tRNA nucleotidyltransferase/poly(A) polymerase